MIELKDIRAGYHGQEVLHGISLTFSPERYWPLGAQRLRKEYPAESIQRPAPRDRRKNTAGW